MHSSGGDTTLSGGPPAGSDSTPALVDHDDRTLDTTTTSTDVCQRLGETVVLQQKRLQLLQDCLLARLDRLTGHAHATPTPPADREDESGDDAQTLLGALVPSAGVPGRAPLGSRTPTTTPVIVLDVTSLYSARGVGRPLAANTAARCHVGVQTSPPTVEAAPTSENSPAGLNVTTASTDEAHESAQVRQLRDELAAAQARALFQQESLVCLANDLAKLQDTMRMLSQEDEDAAELQAHTRPTACGASERPHTATTRELSEAAKDRELRRLRTLLRFSELKKDSDLLPQAYTHLDAALKETAALRDERTADRGRLKEAQQCVRTIAGCVLELQGLFALPHSRENDGAVRDCLVYALERCREVDPSIPSAPLPSNNAVGLTTGPHVRDPVSRRPTMPSHRARGRSDPSPVWPPPAVRGDSLAPPPRSPVTPCSASAHMETASATVSESAGGRAHARVPTVRRHSAASYARVQEAVAHARREDTLDHADARARASRPRHRARTMPTGADAGLSTGPAPMLDDAPPQYTHTRRRPPMPDERTRAPFHSALEPPLKRPSVPGGGSMRLSRSSSVRSETWI